MNETSKRIKAYQEMLPGLKERVAAVALLLVMSLAMMTSATFAWLTLSRAPEVAEVSTTVAANGNLEIALSNPEGTQPEESKVGDSMSADGQDVVKANLTWGNLVNLSDPSYGLDHLTLRPAALGNSSTLLSTPLISVDYGQDGRVESSYNYDFNFTNWNEERGFFEYPSQTTYGVRAISSLTYVVQDDNEVAYNELAKLAKNSIIKAAGQYRTITGDNDEVNDNMEIIVAMLENYMSIKMKDADEETAAFLAWDCTKYIPTVYQMMYDLQEAYKTVGDSIAAVANAQFYRNELQVQEGALSKAEIEALYLTDGSELYTPVYADDGSIDVTATVSAAKARVAAMASAGKSGKSIVLNSLEQYVKDRCELETALAAMIYNEETKEGFYDVETGSAKTTMWRTEETDDNDFEAIVNKLVNIGTCTVATSKDDAGTALNSLGASAATDLLGKDIYARINAGLIKNFETYIDVGYRIYMTNIEVTVVISMTAKAVTTAAYTAGENGLVTRDLLINSAWDASSVRKEGTAKETYGMAIDLWTRTNAANSYLVLEGNVLTREEKTPATLVLPSGEVPLYNATVYHPTEGGLLDSMLATETRDVYPRTQTVVVGEETTAEVEMWFFADTLEPAYQYQYDGNGYMILEDGQPALEATTVNDTACYVSSLSTETEVVGIKIDSSTQKMNTEYIPIGYEGENRIWEENSMMVVTPGVNYTTQGSGSCYVFYADNPTDQQNSLKLLSNLRVAFLRVTSHEDDDGNTVETAELAAMAKLDTSIAYESSGKVTIPLVLTEEGLTNALQIPDTTGSDASATRLAITAMEQNEPVRLTMIVYLEGGSLTNDQVLAANEIQGKLNVQFGSAVPLVTAGNEALESETVSLSATVTPNSFDYDTATDPMTSQVSVRVDGVDANSVTAFFIRKINSTQGTPQATITLQDTDGDGIWEGTHTFTTPGEYILRAATVDGKEYDLTEEKSVKITGFGFSYSTGLNMPADQDYVTVFTGDNSYTTSVTVDFTTDDPDKMPQSVQAQFLGSDGQAVTALLTYNPNTTQWTGNARFTKSGDYTLTYIIMDGDYVELGADDSEAVLPRVVLTLGVNVVLTDNFLSANDRRFEYDQNGSDVILYAVIRDGSNKPLLGLDEVVVTYSASAANQPDATLHWDESRGAYTNTMKLLGAGTYDFSKMVVSVGGVSSTITNGTGPTYRILPPDPPVYVGAEGSEYTLAQSTSDKVTLQVEFTNVDAVSFDTTAGTYDARAWVADENGTKYMVPLSGKTTDAASGAGELTFALPGEGTWTLLAVDLINVVDENGHLYESFPEETDYDAEGDYLRFDLSGESGSYKVEVLKLEVTQPTERSFEGAFLESFTVADPVTVKITNQKGQKLDARADLSAISFELRHTGTTKYSSTSLTTLSGGGWEQYVRAWSASASSGNTIQTTDGITFVADAVTLHYDGSYTATGLTITLGDQVVTKTLSGFAVTQEMPTVTATSLAYESSSTAVGSNPTEITYTLKSLSWGRGTEPTFTATNNQTSGIATATNTVTAYALATADNDTQRHGLFYRPVLTVTVDGAGDGSAVSFVLSKGDATSDITFSRTGDGEITAALGVKQSSYRTWTSYWIYTHTLDAYLGHGEQTIDEITVVKDGVTYVVTLDTPLKIINPSSTNH